MDGMYGLGNNPIPEESNPAKTNATPSADSHRFAFIMFTMSIASAVHNAPRINWKGMKYGSAAKFPRT